MHCFMVQEAVPRIEVDKLQGHLYILMRASQNGYCEVVILLLEKGAQVNLLDGDAWSALMCASLNGHCEVVKSWSVKGKQ